jgi:serine/threonine protein kinase
MQSRGSEGRGSVIHIFGKRSYMFCLLCITSTAARYPTRFLPLAPSHGSAFKLSHIQVLHRDIKSQNVFIAANGAIKIGDLGVAKLLGTRMQVPLTVFPIIPD